MDRLLNGIRDSVIAVSEEVKRDYKEKTGIDERKCLVIYNGIDTEDFGRAADIKGLKRELDLGEDDIIITCISRLVPQKDHYTLLKAAGILVGKVPKLKFLIVGGGKMAEELKGFARKLNLEKNVVFAGKREDISDILALTDISVLCSVKEGFSNVILESMAAAKPVIATDVGGNREAILDGKTGYLVPKKDYNLLADKILLLVNNKDKREEMGRNGRRRVKERFSIEVMAAETKKLYFGLLKKKGLI
jgi:glycosyltransferase involved in cell wall biosynthesis